MKYDLAWQHWDQQRRRIAGPDCGTLFNVLLFSRWQFLKDAAAEAAVVRLVVAARQELSLASTWDALEAAHGVVTPIVVGARYYTTVGNIALTALRHGRMF
jgi:hypothetical protein